MKLSKQQNAFGKSLITDIAARWDVTYTQAVYILLDLDKIHALYKWVNLDYFLNTELNKIKKDK